MIALAVTPNGSEEDWAIGVLAAFIGFSWAALTAYLKPWHRYFGGAALIGNWFVWAGVAGINLEAADATVTVSCAIYACVYLMGILIDMALHFRQETKRTD